MKRYRRLLTIAGSDSGGGAGIQADLKTFAACGCYGMSAITAITAQNTLEVKAIHPVPVEMIADQIRAVCDDIGIDGVKIGMLHSKEAIQCVAEVLAEYQFSRVVFDPVMVATSGDRLLEDDGVASMKERLFGVVDLITPNIPEAEILVGRKLHTNKEAKDAAHELAATYSLNVLLKTAHLGEGQINDILVPKRGGREYIYANVRQETRNSHGTGCTLSAAIAAFWAQELTLDKAVAEAEKYLHWALEAGAAYELGHGHGPVHHFFGHW